MSGGLELREAGGNDRSEIERLARAALDALADSPSVQQWGPDMVEGYVASWLPAPQRGTPLLAVRDSTIVGMASVTQSRRHPAHKFLRITVDPAHRGRGMGTALYDAVVGTGSFMVREFQSDPATIAFYADRGFVDGERATEGRIDPAHPATLRWVDRTMGTAGDVTVLPAEASPAGEREVAGVIDEVYRRTLSWSPPAPLREDQLEDTYLAEALPGTRFCAHDGSYLVGAGLLTRSPFGADQHVAHLVWVGVADPNRDDAAAVTADLAAHCLAAARKQGRHVQVEVNTTHPELYHVINSIPGADLFEDLTIMIGPT